MSYKTNRTVQSGPTPNEDKKTGLMEWKIWDIDNSFTHPNQDVLPGFGPTPELF